MLTLVCDPCCMTAKFAPVRAATAGTPFMRCPTCNRPMKLLPPSDINSLQREAAFRDSLEYHWRAEGIERLYSIESDPSNSHAFSALFERPNDAGEVAARGFIDGLSRQQAIEACCKWEGF